MGLRGLGPLGEIPKGKKEKKEGEGPAALGGPNGAHLGQPAALLGAAPHVGFSPTWGSQGRRSPPFSFKYRSPMPLENTQVPLSFSPTLSGVPILELRTRREVSLWYAHRRAARSTLPLTLLCWIWSPEVVIHTVCVWNREAPSFGAGSNLLPLHDPEVGAVVSIDNVCAGT